MRVISQADTDKIGSLEEDTTSQLRNEATAIAKRLTVHHHIATMMTVDQAIKHHHHHHVHKHHRLECHKIDRYDLAGHHPEIIPSHLSRKTNHRARIHCT